MLAMMYLNGKQILPVIHQVLYPLSDRAPVGSCVWVDKESIARGYTEQTYAAQRNATRLKHTDLRDSMLYYLQTSSKLGGAICASMLQVRPLCYCIIDLAHQDSTEHLYTEMFNMVRTANSTLEKVSSHETLSFCGAPVELPRYRAVGFRYTTPSGTVMDRVTDGLPSILVQQMSDVMQNTFKCPPLVPRLSGPG
jgi:peptide deformylase